MRTGVVFPSPEIPADPAAIRAFAVAVEELGYDHILVFDHVVGVDPARRPGWSGPYDHGFKFHEPMVLFGFLAAVTRRIELTTGIVILPQRQTALVAKQAAEVDVLSEGRLRLGVGIGWNEPEYEALGEDFTNRGRRLEEQVAVLRTLWADPIVDFRGRWHDFEGVGLNPMPVQRPIPLWGGAFKPAAIARVARLLDGWMPRIPFDAEAPRRIEAVREQVQAAGRDPAAFGLDPTVAANGDDPEAWAREAEGWRGLGVSHVTLRTIQTGRSGLDAHLDAMRRFREAWPAQR